MLSTNTLVNAATANARAEHKALATPSRSSVMPGWFPVRSSSAVPWTSASPTWMRMTSRSPARLAPATGAKPQLTHWNVGLFYTMPGGTELRLTYSEVDNDDNGSYGQGISGTGLGSPGAEIEMFAVGIVHWFD